MLILSRIIRLAFPECVPTLRIFRRVSPSRSQFVLPIIFNLISAVLDAVFLYSLLPFFSFLVYGELKWPTGLLGDYFNSVSALIVGPSSSPTFMSILFVTATLFIAYYSCNYFAAIVAHKSIQSYLRTLKAISFRRLLSFGFRYFEKSDVGKELRVLGYIATLGGTLRVVNRFVMQFFVFSAYLCLSVYLIGPWAIGLALGMLCVSIAFRKLLVRLTDKSRAEERHMIKASQFVTGSILNISLIKSNVAELIREFQFRKIIQKQYDISLKIAYSSSIVRPVQEGVLLICMLGLVWWLDLIISDGISREATLPHLALFLILVRRMIAGNQAFTNLRIAFSKSAGPSEKYSKFFEDADKHFVTSGTVKFSAVKKNIEIRNLSFGYDDEKILNGLNLEIPSGKTMALVGESGSGKSTLLKLLIRHYNCPPDTIFIDGVDLNQYQTESFLKRCAYVGQDTELMNESIRSNLCFSLENEVPEDLLWEALEKSCLKKFVSELPSGLDTIVGDRGIRLSGGEKQRLAIARAFLRNAEVLIFDEATSALDTKTEAEIQKAIDQALKRRTGIMVAHRYSTIMGADIVAYMENGAIVEVGSPRELLDKKGKFFTAWSRQNLKLAG